VRRRVLKVALTAVAVAVLLLGIPLAFAVQHIVTNDERLGLERLALRTALTVSPGFRAGDPVELPAAPDGTELGVYDARGARVTGTGPAGLESGATPALKGSVVGADAGERLVAAVPVADGERVIGVVRAAAPESVVQLRTGGWLVALAAACVFAALIAAAFAARQSTRLVAPVTALARAAHALGAGDFGVRQDASGVAELDAAGEALNRTAARLGETIERERAFTAHASHQLRTPLTQIQLELERGLERGGDALGESVRAAMTTADQLSRTIDDVLDVTRARPAPAPFPVEELLEECRGTWQGPLARDDRPLRVVVDEPLLVAASLPAVRQILTVLLDNAFRHGSGTVTIRCRESHGAVAVDVVDEGDPQMLSDGDGLGLTLARSLASAEQGRLLLDRSGPGTRFTVLLPAPAG